MWQEYFEQFIRPQLRDLAGRQVSGRELIERLRDPAAALGVRPLSCRRKRSSLSVYTL
jgi:hypothetical protein